MYKTKQDRIMIKATLQYCFGFVPGLIKDILEERGFFVTEKGNGLDLVFHISKIGKPVEVEFYFHNLYLEIATKDRDAELLEFDDRLLNFDFFLVKICKTIEGKLRPLFIILPQQDTEKAIEEMKQISPDYERILVIKIDRHERR